MNANKLVNLMITILILALSIATIFFSCDSEEDNSDQETDSDDADDGTQDDDDNDDDSSDDDDVTDDDDDEDDDSEGHPPILSNVDLVYTPSKSGKEWIDLKFYFDVCDLGDDLEGGYFITRENLVDNIRYFSELGIPLSPADDCNKPISIVLDWSKEWDIFPTEVCIDFLVATDNAGYSSVPAYDICEIIE